MEKLLYGKSSDIDSEEITSPLITQFIQLYFRCRRFAGMQLPEAGGILDQEEITMQAFEIIHDVVSEYEQERQKDAMSKMQQQARVTEAKRAVMKRGLR